MFLAARALVTLFGVVQAQEFLTRKTSKPDFSILFYFDQNLFNRIVAIEIAENGVEKEMKMGNEGNLARGSVDNIVEICLKQHNMISNEKFLKRWEETIHEKSFAIYKPPSPNFHNFQKTLKISKKKWVFLKGQNVVKNLNRLQKLIVLLLFIFPLLLQNTYFSRRTNSCSHGQISTLVVCKLQDKPPRLGKNAKGFCLGF